MNIKKEEADLAKNDKGQAISMACFDFQKVLSAPHTEASCLYYKRKLAIYNFTTENDAKRGSDEVSTCVLNYIERKVNQGIKEFWLYSDNCGGQNRNRNLVSPRISKIWCQHKAYILRKRAYTE